MTFNRAYVEGRKVGRGHQNLARTERSVNDLESFRRTSHPPQAVRKFGGYTRLNFLQKTLPVLLDGAAQVPQQKK